MFSEQLKRQARLVLQRYRRREIKIVTAESCTGGLLSALLTEISGSSEVFERGYVTYSDESKTKLLGVSSRLLKKYGAVSKQVVTAMAEGALKYSRADIAVAITGIAGPGGGSAEKPVGLVYVAIAHDNDLTVEEHFFEGDRDTVRHSAMTRALELLTVFSEPVKA